MIEGDDVGSDTDFTNPFRPNGPAGIARACEETIARLEAERDDLPRSKRADINRRIRQVRQMARWCKSRAGYFEVGSSP